MKFFKEDTKTAFEAISQAQQIAFAPIVFQATKYEPNNVINSNKVSKF